MFLPLDDEPASTLRVIPRGDELVIGGYACRAGAPVAAAAGVPQGPRLSGHVAASVTGRSGRWLCLISRSRYESLTDCALVDVARTEARAGRRLEDGLPR
jgi:hypothetical protein